MYNISTNVERCCGCTACKTVCPCNAIVLHADARGFQVPFVDERRCIRCGKCVQACPTLQLAPERIPLVGYACWHKDDRIRGNSTSGGAYSGLAAAVLRQGGVCFGATYADDFMKVFHASSDQMDPQRFCKSKYVQSDLRTSFSEVLDAAKTGRKVLFCGTPCECAGLSRIAGSLENVYSVDFICGGVPSPKCYEQHLRRLAKDAGAPVVGVDFRSKESGWKKQYLDVSFSNGKKYHRYYLHDPFFSMFYDSHLITNFICDACPFRRRHEADVTIADFWGYANAGLKYDDKGISLVLVNTRRGQELFDQFADKRAVELSPGQYAYALRPFAISDATRRRKRAFFDELTGSDFNAVYPKYVNTNCLHVVFHRLKSYLKRRLGVLWPFR